MSNDQQMRNALIITRLLIERCQCRLAHLNALLHLCEPENTGLDDLVADDARRLIAQVNEELTFGAGTLESIQ